MNGKPGEVLIEIAAAGDIGQHEFAAQFDAPESIEETHKDFELTQQLGIEAFPTLLGFAKQRLTGITVGYQGYDELLPLVDAWYQGAEQS